MENIKENIKLNQLILPKNFYDEDEGDFPSFKSIVINPQFKCN